MTTTARSIGGRSTAGATGYGVEAARLAAFVAGVVTLITPVPLPKRSRERRRVEEERLRRERVPRGMRGCASRAGRDGCRGRPRPLCPVAADPSPEAFRSVAIATHSGLPAERRGGTLGCVLRPAVIGVGVVAAVLAGSVAAGSVSRDAGSGRESDAAVLFVRQLPGARQSLNVISADGSRQRSLGVRGSEVVLPTWSPDGRRIASHLTVRFRTSLVVVNADGRRRQVLVRPRESCPGAPVWSPKGRRIAYTENRQCEGDYSLDIVDTATGRRTVRLKFAHDAAWSPDGRMLAYDHGERVVVMRADGSRRRLIPGSLTSFWSGYSNSPRLAWAPWDGRRIFYVRGGPMGPNYRSLRVINSTAPAGATSPPP